VPRRSSGTGGDIVVLTGAAVEAPDEPPASANPDYLAKYGDWITRGWQTAANSSIYSEPVRIRVERVRGH
jgi:hypothetical protein